MARRIIRSHLFWTAFTLWAAFLPIIWLAPARELFEVLNALIIAVSCGILFGFVRAARDIIPTRPSDLRGSDALILGIITVMAGLVIIFANLWVWRIFGGPPAEPPAIINHWTGAFGRWMVVTGGAMLLVASGAIQGRIPPASYMRTGGWIALGIAAAGIMMTLGFR
jgi:hypothetical protein